MKADGVGLVGSVLMRTGRVVAAGAAGCSSAGLGWVPGSSGAGPQLAGGAVEAGGAGASGDGAGVADGADAGRPGNTARPGVAERCWVAAAAGT